MKQVIESGRLGKIAAVTTIQTLPGNFQTDNWRCHPETNPGGALMQLGIHMVETLMYLFGPITGVQGFFAPCCSSGDR